METFSGYLRGLREGRALTLGQLSLRSGVNKATLSRWEGGQCQPRLPELELVLTAMETPPPARARCLHLLNVPRAVLAVRRASEVQTQLSLGDMLYGLRQRAGITQAEVARAAGVSRSLYSQWERDTVRPTTAQIHAAGFALGAAAEEVATLSAREFAAISAGSSRDALLQEYMNLIPWGDGMTESSYKLRLFSLLARIAHLVRQGKADSGDLAVITGDFAACAMIWTGDQESINRYSRRALALATNASEPLHFHLAGTVGSLLDTANNPRPFKVRLGDALSWQPRFKDDKGKAYMLSFLARAIAEEAPEQALQLADEYCTLVADNPDEYPCRLRDRGNLLLKCGQAAQSVAFIATLTPQDSYRAVLQQFEMAKGFIALGAFSEARTCMDTGTRLMDTEPSAHLRDVRETLQRSLA